MTVPDSVAPGARKGDDAVGAEIDQLAATLRDIRAGYRKRRQEVDEIEAHVSTSEMSAGQAAAVMAALHQARELGRRLLDSLDDDEVRLRKLRELLAE